MMLQGVMWVCQACELVQGGREGSHDEAGGTHRSNRMLNDQGSVVESSARCFKRVTACAHRSRTHNHVDHLLFSYFGSDAVQAPRFKGLLCRR